MAEPLTDTTDMLVVHDCLRHEFARLPITVKAVAEGDADRASVVGGHVLFMCDEQEVVPLISRDLTAEEWVSVGEHSRAEFTPDVLAVALGLILDDTTPDRAERILAEMPPEARAGFEQFGRAAHANYRARLTDY